MRSEYSKLHRRWHFSVSVEICFIFELFTFHLSCQMQAQAIPVLLPHCRHEHNSQDQSSVLSIEDQIFGPAGEDERKAALDIWNSIELDPLKYRVRRKDREKVLNPTHSFIVQIMNLKHKRYDCPKARQVCIYCCLTKMDDTRQLKMIQPVSGIISWFI